MDTWTHGYVAEINYTHGFYRELTPAHLSLALLLKGIRPPSLTAPFAYCELGCGQGVSANIHAAANPAGVFWATDFNPAHAAGARHLAEAAQSTNAVFFDNSFAEFLEADTPAFDFICLHGVYSWISEENRRVIAEIIRRKLKPGGIVYNSYNCQPGWASAMPLRELMTGHAAHSNEPIVGRINKALEFADRLKSLGGGYFAQNPAVAPRLERLSGMSRNYLAHEYFNRDWHPLYHSDVAREMGLAKLQFAASAHFGDHMDVLNFSADAQKLLAEIGDATFREVVRDFIINQQFRRDIFVKGSTRLAPSEHQAILRETRFALLIPAANLPETATFPVGSVTLRKEIYGPIVELLARGPMTLGELVDDKSRADLTYSQVLQALTVLLAQGHVAPALPRQGETERRSRTNAFNAAILQKALHSDEVQYLASPVTGGGVSASRLDQLFILAMQKGEDPALFAWRVFAQQGQRLIKDGKPLTTEEENLAELREKAALFREKTCSTLLALGAIAA